MGDMNPSESLKTGAAAGRATAPKPRAGGQPGPPVVRWGFIGVGGRGTRLLQQTLAHEGVKVTAVCNLDGERLHSAIAWVREACGDEPAGYSDYRRLLARDDVDAVFVATPMQWHGRMAADALRAGKHVLSEVAGAVTLEECWDLVRARKESGCTYMLAENVCYYPANLMIQRMVDEGRFGVLTGAECGYVHDCRSLLFKPDGSLTWRGELARTVRGNWYPTHAIGPVAQWLGINRTDRFVSLVSRSSQAVGVRGYAAQRFGVDHPAARFDYAGDTNTTLIKTAAGALIDLRFDISSARPHPSTTHFTLQGATASYSDREGDRRVWLAEASEEPAWKPLSRYEDAYRHPLWKRWGEQAATTGHGGADFFVVAEFLETLRTGRPSPLDAVDSATWSCLIPLTGKSVEEGGAVQEIPDFSVV